MEEAAVQTGNIQSWTREKIFMSKSLGEYIRSLITPFNIIAGLILVSGLFLVLLRFAQGLSVIMHPSYTYPWGLYIAFGLLCMVPLAAPGFVMASVVYIFGLKEYRPLLKPAVLLGLLGYISAVVFLLIDLGRPWRLPYPMFVSHGTASILFFVSWSVASHVLLYTIEFFPAILSWLGETRFRRWISKLGVGAAMLVVMLSTLHQSGLGALFLLMPGKVHPLWYSQYLPVFFFISSIFAGLSMVILVSALSVRYFKERAGNTFLANIDNLTLGLGKAASVVLFVYFALKIIGIANGNNWNLLGTTPYGLLFLVELFFFVLLPCFLFATGFRSRNVPLVRVSAVITIAGLILNRINVALTTFNWQLHHREIPKWTEFVIAAAIISFGMFAYRWIVNRMDVLKESSGDTH